MPIMDGSSKEFISIINKVGLKKQNSQRKFLKINEKIIILQVKNQFL